MQPEDRLRTETPSRDSEWPGEHPALDVALAAAIRAPVADARFDREVWARIGAESAARAAEPQRRPRVGQPLWLSVLNVIGVGVAVIAVVYALGTAVHPIAKSAPAALTLVEHSPSAMRMVALVVIAAALWLGLRRTPFARAIVRQWL